jgi:multidrug efflux system outer membrane protein
MKPIKISAALLSVLLAGCASLAPELKTPAMDVPGAYREAATLEGKFRLASEPTQQNAEWWTIFNDATLNDLQARAKKSNATIQSAAARVEQAQALVRQTTGTFYPSVTLIGNASRSDLTPNASPASSFFAAGTLSYEAQTLVKIKDARVGSTANKQAAAELLKNAELIVAGGVAENYFMLRRLHAEKSLLAQTIKARSDSQNLIQKRFQEGETTKQDLLRAQAELATTQAELSIVLKDMALVNNALAVLCGETASNFQLAEASLPKMLPEVPAGLPSSLLERRPDIRSAQQTLIVNNARIGIARAAFFPNISLTAISGFASDDLGELFRWSNKAWALGPLFGTAFSLPIFDAGQRAAGVDEAKARFAESSANYRQQVLVAFKDVEDSLATLFNQKQQYLHLQEATSAATEAAAISKLRYEEGEANYLEVLDTQRDALAAQRALTQVQGLRFVSTVQLIRALGGGWVEGTPEATEVIQPVTAPVQQPATEPMKLDAMPQAAQPLAPMPTPALAPAKQPQSQFFKDLLWDK